MHCEPGAALSELSAKTCAGSLLASTGLGWMLLLADVVSEMCLQVL